MRDFQGKGNTLRRLSWPAKALYATYSLLTTAGFMTSVALYWDGLGLNGESAARWYLGNADDPAATEIVIEKSTRELLQITHQHLFAMSVALLVLGHLFLRSRGGAWKGAVVAAAGVMLALHVAAPWLVMKGGAGFGWVMPLTALPFVALFVFMALWPMPDLVWAPEKE